MPDETSAVALDPSSVDPSTTSPVENQATGPDPIDQSSVTPAAPVITPDELAQLRAAAERSRQLEAQLSQYAPVVEEIRKEREQAELQALIEKYKPLTEIEDLDPAVKNDFQQVVADAIEFRRQRPAIEQERTAAAALNIAARIVASDPRAREVMEQFQGVANQLYKLGNIDAMQTVQPIFQKEWEARIQQRVNQNAATRIQTGADTPPSTTAGGGGALSIEAIESKIASAGGRVSALTETEKKRYADYRRANGLPVFSALLS